MGYTFAGIDVGTTFSSAAIVHDDGQVELIKLGGHAASMPSVITVREDGELLLGDSAEERGPVSNRRTSPASSNAVSATRRRWSSVARPSPLSRSPRCCSPTSTARCSGGWAGRHRATVITHPCRTACSAATRW